MAEKRTGMNRFAPDALIRRLSGSALLLPVLLTVVWVGTGCDGAATATLTEPSTDRARVVFADHAFDVEIADDPDERFRGLSDRDHIAPDGGMLFVFPKNQRMRFVMRDCLVPIDIAFLDTGGRVIATHAMAVEPYGRPDEALVKYDSRWPARFALELAGGRIAEIGLAEGDRLAFDADALLENAR